jgi:uncharacterized protein YkwD
MVALLTTACLGKVPGEDPGLDADLVAIDAASQPGVDAPLGSPDAALPADAMGSLLASLSEDERGTFLAINEARTSRGLSAVELRADLICAARNHSDDIGPREACTHTGSDGSDAGDRLAACDGEGWSNEIVSCGYSTPQGAVDGWLTSPSHRYAMLKSTQAFVGVGSNNEYRTALFDR